jgi:hypothetical protein
LGSKYERDYYEEKSGSSVKKRREVYERYFNLIDKETETPIYPDEVDSDVEYSVQIGSFKSLDFSELSKGFESADVLQKDSLSTLVIGSYSSLLEAQDLLDIVVKVGVENAYIVAYKNGKNVGLLSNKTTN